MSKGSLGGSGDEDDRQKKEKREEQEKELLGACPHMRVLSGKELEAAMGPSIFWVFKHLRVFGTVYQKKQSDLT